MCGYNSKHSLQDILTTSLAITRLTLFGEAEKWTQDVSVFNKVPEKDGCR